MLETITDDRGLDLAYQAIARDPKYAHFVNIPERIVRCLDHFGVVFDRVAVTDNLCAYYLFIGVVDDAIDSGNLEIGRDILERFHTQVPSFDHHTLASRVRLVTEVLKQHVRDDVYPLMLRKLHGLYRAVVAERKAETIAAYIEQRRVVGHLTAELSYVLIRPFLNGDDGRVRRLLKQVGAVGCLVDSMIDLRSDSQLGLLSFKPTISDRLKLMISTLGEGLSVLMKHPALLGVFLEAVSDNVRDRFRTGSRPAPRFVETARVQSSGTVFAPRL